MQKYPHQIDELYGFEKDLIQVVKNIEFKI